MQKGRFFNNKKRIILMVILYGVLLFDLLYFFMGVVGIVSSYLYFLTYTGPILSMAWFLSFSEKNNLTSGYIFRSNAAYILVLLLGMLIWVGIYAIVYPVMIPVIIANYIVVFTMCFFYGAVFYVIYKAVDNIAVPVGLLVFYTLNSICPWSSLLNNISYAAALDKKPETLIASVCPYILIIFLIYGAVYICQKRALMINKKAD